MSPQVPDLGDEPGKVGNSFNTPLQLPVKVQEVRTCSCRGRVIVHPQIFWPCCNHRRELQTGIESGVLLMPPPTEGCIACTLHKTVVCILALGINSRLEYVSRTQKRTSDPCTNIWLKDHMYAYSEYQIERCAGYRNQVPLLPPITVGRNSCVLLVLCTRMHTRVHVVPNWNDHMEKTGCV